MSFQKFAVGAALAFGIICAILPAASIAHSDPNDIPTKFVKPDARNDYIKRVEMIPMRDGVKLYTVIVIPKGAHDAPIILTRTPYNAKMRAERNDSPSMLATLPLADEDYVRAGYIRVYQDIRGKYGSEGPYEMTRAAIGPFNHSKTDDTTDAWDTIDWLVKNIHESNGKVGMIGSSYEGWTVVMALLDPHPALKAAIPESPMVDGWMGDDWFHYGAFRVPNLEYISGQEEERGRGGAIPTDDYDAYTMLMEAGTPGAIAQANGFEQLGFWKTLSEHPAYDAFWQDQDLARKLAAHPSNVPTMWEQGLWDQEDMWGANHSFAALKAVGHESNNWLVMGPWFHSQVNREGWMLGPFKWNGDTALQFRRDMTLPFFNQYLKGGPRADLARAMIYNPAENHWDRFNDWPIACETGCKHSLTPIYLQANGGLGFEKPQDASAGDSYISDPIKPVPYLPRPVRFNDEDAWRTWLVRDQRFVDGRPDVLTYETPLLTKTVRLEGAPLVDLVASTTGTDGDFVVRLIDVYPSEYPSQPELGGYELPIGTDIFRGRYRESFEHPSPIPANTPQHYRFALPNANYEFLPGHRIMVMVQSTLFPLYDRNPQTYVDNILFAKPQDFQKATITVLHSSAIWLPAVPPAD
jgi:putative CocE/NonD family hydrolase